jgi:hypothetical protein
MYTYIYKCIYKLEDSDFNNVIMPTLGWLHNKDLGYVDKRRFCFYDQFSAPLDSKFKKVAMRPPKILGGRGMDPIRKS